MKPKTYIKIWLVIALYLNVILFFVLQLNAGTLIKCNREYKKVYPCRTNEVVAYVPLELGEEGALKANWYYESKQSTSKKEETEPVDREPGLVEGEKLQSDTAVILEILFGVDLLVAGMALLLYFVLTNMDRRPVLSFAITISMVALIVSFGYASQFLFKRIGEPARIREVHYNAPIIYLYDEQEREAKVKLDINGALTCTYPRYDEESGWIVKTSSDGILTDSSGRKYEYLYWEADVDMDPDFSKGFCVKGEDSAAFLEKALSDLGLSDTEANTFIMYWLPDLEENPYNVISFQTKNYENAAKLNVDPLPDTVVRVNMLFYGSDEYVNIEEQDLTEMNPSLDEREGFVLVEWGGGKLE